MISIEAHRAAIGSYYTKARHMSNSSENLMSFCYCKRYEDIVFQLSGYNYLTVLRYFDCEVMNIL